MGTLRVLAPRRFTAGQTFGRTAVQALELFTCAPSTRYGAASTSSAERPPRVTTSGMGAAAIAAHDENARPAIQENLYRMESPRFARPDSIEIWRIVHFLS